jgi:thiosulfate reductase cytochrome b subunit
MELARRLAWAALGSSVLLIAAAIASNATGVHLVDVNTGGEVNSHATATWVLGTFALVFLLHAVVLFAWANEQLWPVRPRDRRR